MRKNWSMDYLKIGPLKTDTDVLIYWQIKNNSVYRSYDTQYGVLCSRSANAERLCYITKVDTNSKSTCPTVIVLFLVPWLLV